MRNNIRRLLVASALTLAGATSAMAQVPASPSPTSRLANHVPGTGEVAPEARKDFHAAPAARADLAPSHHSGHAEAEQAPRRHAHHRHTRAVELRPTPEMHRLEAEIAESHAKLEAAQATGDEAAILAMSHRLKRDHAALRAAQRDAERQAHAEFHEPRARPGEPPRLRPFGYGAEPPPAAPFAVAH